MGIENYDAWRTRSPRYEEPEAVLECECCRADIYENEDYYEIADSIYCENCVMHGKKVAH